MGGKWIVGGLLAAALSLAAGAAQAVEIINFENLPLGPISGVIDGRLSLPTSLTATIVDTGGGNQALQLTGNDIVSLTFLGHPRITSDVEELYHMLSLDFWSATPTFYTSDSGLGGGWTGGLAPAGQWITFDLSSAPVGGNHRIFWSQSGTPLSVLVDNFTYEFAGLNAVPEPSSWALIVVGFGLIGFQLRRRHLASA